MADVSNQLQQILANQIRLANNVIKSANQASTFKRECNEITYHTLNLIDLLRQAVRLTSTLCERPTRRIIGETERVLTKAHSLVRKCRSSRFVVRLLTAVSASSFWKIRTRLGNSVADVSWLVRVSTPTAVVKDHQLLGLPPIACYQPNLYLIWEQIAVLSNGSVEEKSDAAASLAVLVRDSGWYGWTIVEEGGVGPLIKLMMERKSTDDDVQENVVRVVGLIGKDWRCAKLMVEAGVCFALAKLLKEGTMRVQAVAAWAVSELAGNYPKCQDIFAKNDVIQLLVMHLAFEIVPQNYNSNSKHAIVCKANLIHAIDDENDGVPLALTYPIAGNGRESVDAATKVTIKAKAARALWNLAKDNPNNSRCISESSALLCFAILLEKGTEDLRFNCAMALMVITAVAEKDMELGKCVFTSSSPTCRTVVDQLLKIIDKGDSESNLLIPCITSIGNLARIFRATDTRVISSLVKLLDSTNADISIATSIALTKFTCTENYLHVSHSKAILSAGGAEHLVLLVYIGEKLVQIHASLLLSYIAFHVPDSEELVKNDVLNVLDWASTQHGITQSKLLEKWLLEAMNKMQLYQPRGWGFR